MTEKKFDKIYIDMDGVLADFDQHFINLFGVHPELYEDDVGTLRYWETVYEQPDFFSTIPTFAHYFLLVKTCLQHADKVVILSSPSRVNKPLCMIEKRKWVDYHLGRNFPAIFESDKHKYAGKHRLLIDDSWNKCIKWEEQGGVAWHFEADKVDEFFRFLREYKRPGKYDE